MTLESRIFYLIELLISLKDDEKVVAKVEDLLKQERIRKYEDSLRPMTVNELRERALAAHQDVLAGRGTDIDDMEKEMESW